jgi:hypothetical protein
MRYGRELRRMRHPTESALLSFARGQVEGLGAADLSAHLDGCLACRIWETRLRNAEVAEADGPVTARLAAAAPAIPDRLRSALLAPAGAAVPAAGEIWRVGTDEALLVWVRQLADESATVIPVTLDADLADGYTLVVPAGESPLGLDLALISTVEGQVDLRAFRQWVAVLPVGDQITRLRSARGGDVSPAGLLTGSPISRGGDQRLEYRQLLADLLAGLAPGAFTDFGGTGGRDDGGDADRLAEALNGLTWRRPGVEISFLDRAHVSVGPALDLLITALVRDLDAAVLVAVLSGADSPGVLSAPVVARACGELLMTYPDAEDVAVAIPDEEWTAVVIAPEFASRAVEAPSGRLMEPSVAFQPLPLTDALLKHLDSRVTRWEETDRVRFDRDAVDVAALAAVVSQAAVDKAAAEGRRARTPAKKTAYTALDDSAVAGIRLLIESAVAPGGSPADAVAALLGPRR